MFWGIALTLFLAISPKLQEIDKKKFTIGDWIAVASALASAGLNLMDYHGSVPGTYTPKWLPGRNREEGDSR
jgi:hypothetical protein